MATNHFVNTEWGRVLMKSTGFRTLGRRSNLFSIGHKNKGEINAGRMMEILDIQMNQGGATWPAGEKIQTVYQVIAIPGELKLCFKVSVFQDWTFVGPAPLFESENSPK